VPAQLEGCNRRLAALAAEIAALERDAAEGCDTGNRLPALRDERGNLQARHAELAVRWDREKALGARIRRLT
jgi:type VI secretion system protein VasG